MNKLGKILMGLLVIITSCIYIMKTKALTTTIGDTSELKSINIIKNVTNVTSNVNATFYYSVSEERSENPESITGINENFSITFNNVEPINNTASVTSALDLSSLTFTKVGDYYLKICEIASSDEEVYPIDDKCYYPMVMVRYELNGNTPTGNLIATLMSSVYDGENKTDAVFTTRPKSYITLGKMVSGDMADRDEYFKFKITINDDNLDNIVIKNQDATVMYNGEEIITSSTYNPSGDNYVYLKHGQIITIGENDSPQLRSGISYTIEEMDSENYKTYINDSTIDNKLLNVEKMSHISEENTNTFVNNYEAVTFTGVVLNIIPYLLLLVMALVLFILTRKKYANK